MHLHPAPLSLAILVATAGIATAAPPADRGLTTPLRLRQADSGQTLPPEDFPARPRDGQKAPPVRDPAAPSPIAEKGETEAAAKGKAAAKGGAAAKGKGCGKPGCTSCIPQVAACKAKWEDKK